MWQISRCDFDGRFMTVVYGGIRSRPAHFEVDPYNGYLFWSIRGTSDESGLFRLDLSVVSNGVRREVTPFTVKKGPNIGAFTIDYAQFSLFIPIESDNAMIQIDFDGRKEENIRQNTQSSEFSSVTSIAIADKKFYWTNGPSIFREDFHEGNKKFYHTKILHFAEIEKYLFVGVNALSAQPIPVPTHPPSNVQVILSERNGKVSWNTPHLLSIQGTSSWQNWNYEIEIINEDKNNSKTTVRGIKGLHHFVSNLSPNTNYRVRVAAYTNGGYGQFSSEFRAKTLRSPHHRYLMWSSNDGLLQSDILGDHVQILIPKMQLTSQNITGITWFEDLVYFSSNYTLFCFNRTSQIIQQIPELDSVQSIAIDWIGRRLYWFNPLNGVINRGNLKGGEQEPLLSLTARETDLKIDSHRGFMYFSSGHSVEYCRLNGRQKKEYYRKEVYSGKQVMGLTLDMDNDRVYWIVRSYDSSSLLMAPMAGTSATNLQPVEYEMREKEIQGPLTYFSDRLLWLQDDHTVVISNVTGKNLAHLRHIKLIGLKAFAVIDPTQQAYPNVSRAINVIPGQLNASSIRVTGTPQAFIISWDPVENVNHGVVFYDIRCLKISIPESREPFIQIKNMSLPPYSPIDISIRAFTYWGSSKMIKAQLYSPAAAPTKPMAPRVFLSHTYDIINGGMNITATLRWNPPSSPNGPLVAYKVNCWYEKDEMKNTVLWNAEVPAVLNEKIIDNLVEDATYFFEISACSTVEMGNFTAPLSIHTKTERPIPRVLVSTTEAIWVVDLDLQRSDIIIKTRNPAIHLAYMSLHKELFWIDETFDVMTIKDGNRYKLCNASMQVLSMTVDWIERVIYWSQVEKEGGSSLYAYDLNKGTLMNVLKRSGLMYSLVTWPEQQMVLWVEQKTESDISGDIFTHSPHRLNAHVQAFTDSSTIPINTFNKVLVFDTSTRGHSKILWVDDVQTLMSTDLMTNISAPFGHKYNSNTKDLVIDTEWLYWMDENNHILTSPDQKYEMSMKNDTILSMSAFNQQEYPPLDCLIPQNMSAYAPIAMISNTPRSITLKLPSLMSHRNCTLRPTGIKYIVSYRPSGHYDDDCTVNNCKTFETYDQLKVVTDLKPFTWYEFQMRVENHYSNLKHWVIGYGSFVTFITAADAPSAPRNVAAEAINPTEALVTWTPPLEFNGLDVWYEVHWQTKHAIDGVTNRQQLLVNKSSALGNENANVYVTISKLLPKQVYSVSVRAYTTSTSYSEGDALEIETFPEPDNVTLVNATANSFVINWSLYTGSLNSVLSYKQYQNESDDFKVIYSGKSNTNGELFVVNNLEPKTRYVVVVTLEFPRMKKPYEWERIFIFETLPGRPNAPGKPNIKHVSGDVYKVFWAPAQNNGAEIEMYSLEALRYSVSKREPRSTSSVSERSLGVNTLSYTTMVTAPTLVVEESDPLEDTWTVYYNGTETHWIIKNLVPIDKYSFRVRAKNSFGWSAYSELSDIINAPLPSSERYAYMLIATIVPVSITLLLVLVACLFCSKFFVVNESWRK